MSRPIADSLADPRLSRVVAAFQDELDAGRSPDRRAYLRRYPDLAAGLDGCLRTIEFVRATMTPPPDSVPNAPEAPRMSPPDKLDVTRTLAQAPVARDTSVVADTLATPLTPVEPATKTLATGAYEPDKTTDHPSGGMPSATTAVPTVPGYEIRGELGRGGMGVVYLARHVALDRDVALKMILAGANASEQALARFRGEATAVAQLVHPNIVQVYEVGDVGGLPYFSLEYVPGTTLAGRVAKEPQPPAFAAGTVETLARAMDFAHAKGIVHRDLKPANVLLATDGTPKVTDFGLAKRLEAESGQTNSGAILGTPSYMAPEQATGASDAVGPAADTYALGAMLYDLLTGRPPFAGTSLLDTLEMVRTREPAAPSQVVANVPKDLETICLKCLQKEPAKRYASAGALADDLRAYLDGRPIAARPVSSPERAWRWAKRNPIVATLGSAVAALVISTAVISTVLSLRLAKRTDEAEANFKTAETQRIAALAAKDAESKAREVTGEQREIALNIVRKVLTRVDEKMKNDTRLLDLRKDLVAQAMEEVKKLRDHAGANPLADRTDAMAYQKLGEIDLRANQIRDANAAFDRADRIFAALHAAEPTNPIHLRNLAGNESYRGELARRLGDTVEARRLYVRALTLRKAWLAVDNRPAVIHALAQAHNQLGFAHLALGDPVRAEAAFRAEIALRAGLPAYEDQVVNQLDHERAYAGKAYAEAQLRLGLAPAAKATFDGVLADFQSLQARLTTANGKPSDRVIRDLGLLHLTFGDYALVVPKDPAGAEKEYRAGSALLEPYYKAETFNLFYRRDLASAQYRLGVTAALRGDAEEAKKEFTACLTLRDSLVKIDPADTQSKNERMLVLGRLGKQAEVEKDAADLLAVSANDPRIRFFVACGLSLAAAGPDAAAGKRCLDRSLDVLTKLVAGGWTDSWSLANDPDLETVRKDPRFAAVLKSITPQAPIPAD